MSGERTPWVGDLIHDEDADRRGIVTDVQGGAVWVLRPELGPGRWWTSEHPERLTLLESRQR
ncbi:MULTISPECIES: hypothetical protein [unclassified Streptomyces]|uniref:hypothetical protein n=1 Tax=unclassified Streptomyces TaxID=2593676 RepID=UPI0029AEEADC|nr:hypothetical protein [Streptomyces sp. AK02-01A]MDX3855057.1 hypothetical protein [Streptomyces sp. AK02-01A]